MRNTNKKTNKGATKMETKQLTHKESQLIFSILIQKMGYKKNELLSDPKGTVLNNLLKDDFVTFSICYHANNIKEDKVEKLDLENAIESLNKKFNYDKEVA